MIKASTINLQVRNPVWSSRCGVQPGSGEVADRLLCPAVPDVRPEFPGDGSPGLQRHEAENQARIAEQVGQDTAGQPGIDDNQRIVIKS